MSNAHLELSGVGISFPTDKGLFCALQNVNLKIDQGEFVSLIGHSGCGKSTVLNIVAGLYRASTGGVTIMDDLSFCIARVDGRAMRFPPARFSETGVPFYAHEGGQVLAEGVYGPQSSGGNQMLADGSDESVITLGVAPFDSHSISGMKGGKAVWSYPNPWPGLHASHHAARPTFPGQIIGVTRLMGGFVNPKGSDVGPLWAVNANMGNFYLFTRDGLFVATVFEDVRKGTLWKMPVARRGMPLKGISLHDENFWPSISQTPDGQVYIVDGANCSLVRLDGLERRLAGSCR